jgi:hypothetical protein
MKSVSATLLPSKKYQIEHYAHSKKYLDKEKEDILDYNINFELVKLKDDSKIYEMFARLNTNNIPVNKQELILFLQNTLYQATLQRIVKDGLNPENARKSVTKEFKNDYDTTPGTYFIPKDVNGIAVNNAAVKDKADALLLLVEKSDYLERFHVDGGFAHYATLAGNQNVLPENIKLSDANTFNTYVKNTMVY